MKKIIFILTVLLLSTFLFAVESYVPGVIIIKIVTDFTTINALEDSTIVTNQQWFNNLSIQYHITGLRKAFSFSDKAELQNIYTCDFPENVNLYIIFSLLFKNT